jgi:hypothetical protein
VQEAAPRTTQWAEQVRTDALRQVFQQLRQTVHQELTERFAERGIELDEPAVLAVGGQGRVLEVSGHWDRPHIERLLEEDAQLRHRVKQLLDQGRQLWEIDPSAATSDGGQQARLVVTAEEAFFQVV